MLKKIQFVGFIAGCIAIIVIAIQTGRHLENCKECKLHFSKMDSESVKFAEAWK
ncbi:MAG TPA: hypothetical protein VFN95_15055 [Flavitalea sp.]|nr:hypothetical protein [Flavitalea sp.]